MEDRVKKSLWIITVIAALLIPIICFIVTVGRPENVRFITPEALKELIEKKDANFLIVDTQPKAAYKLSQITRYTLSIRNQRRRSNSILTIRRCYPHPHFRELLPCLFQSSVFYLLRRYRFCPARRVPRRSVNPTQPL